MSATDKYPRPWKISASWGGGPEVLNVRDTNGTWIATVAHDLAPAFCAMGDVEAERDKLRAQQRMLIRACNKAHHLLGLRKFSFKDLEAMQDIDAALAKARGEG